MARRTPGRVQMTCSTTGNGPYTLANPSPALTGKRTIAQAVTDGSLVDGDQILYAIVDPTAAGNGKLIEVGLGTINTTTLVLTVVSVYQKSEALTSGGGWGAGTRDVLISPPTGTSTAFTDLSNTFTENQNIEKTDPSYRLRAGGMTRAELLHSGGGVYLFYYNAAGAVKGVILLSDSVAPLWSADGVTFKSVGIVETGSKMVQFPTGGTVKMLFGSAPPTGWTRVNETDDRVIKMAKSTDSAGDSGGSWTVSGLSLGGATDSTILNVSQIPAHDHHAFSFFAAAGGSSSDLQVLHTGSGTQFLNRTDETGEGNGHTHTLGSASVISAGTWRPLYKVWIAATFD